MKAASERAAQSNVKKYVPPKIAPVHYGNVFLTSFILLKFMFLRKLIRLTERFIFVFFLQMETWQRLTGKRLRWSVSGERFWGALWSKSWGSSTATLPRRSETDETSRVNGRVERRHTGRWFSFICLRGEQIRDSVIHIWWVEDMVCVCQVFFVHCLVFSKCFWTVLLFLLLYRRNYEELMMVRLNMPKSQKNSRKRGMMSMSGQLSGITHFSDITALTCGEARQVSSVTLTIRTQVNVGHSEWDICVLSLFSRCSSWGCFVSIGSGWREQSSQEKEETHEEENQEKRWDRNQGLTLWFYHFTNILMMKVH